jgi:hypothetical protein
MRAVVDAASQSIRCGDSAWPFRLDMRQGCATTALADAEYCVRPLIWQEKVRMARFAHLGESFLQSSFLDCCVSSGERVAEEAPILTALAAWINLPDDDADGLPLDCARLSKVTLDVCRSMNIGPSQINDLPAPMVESLWRSLDQALRREQSESTEPAQQPFDTKIVILPDATSAETRLVAATSAEPDQDLQVEPERRATAPAPRRRADRAIVDAANQSVRCGDSAWPFRLDVRQSCATIALADVEYRVRPLIWQEKVRMARFAHLGESFLQSSFLDCCVSSGERGAEAEQILTALAAWVNLPDDDTDGLPLDSTRLAKVTLDVCRSMNVGPSQLNDLPAPMVESLWRSLDHVSRSEQSEQTEPAEEPFDTKIVILPEATPAEMRLAATASAEPVGAAAPMAPARDPQSFPAAITAEMRRAAARSAHRVESTAPVAQASDRPSLPTPMGLRPGIFASHAARSFKTPPAPANSQTEPERTLSPDQGVQEATPAGRQHARFRVSLRTVEPDRPATAPAPPRTAERKTFGTAPALSNAVAGNAALASSDSDFLSHKATRSAPVLESMPEAFALPPTPFMSEAPRYTPAVAGTEERSALPPLGSAAQVSPTIESLLDEFCQRLDEAAADLGILEEV